MATMIPFSFIKSSPNWPSGAMGDLIVFTGQTVTLASGGNYDYRNVTVEPGGTLLFTGGNFNPTVLGISQNLINNGVIRARSNTSTTPRNEQGTYSKVTPDNKTLSYSIVQALGGSGGAGGQGWPGGAGTYGYGGGGSGGIKDTNTGTIGGYPPMTRVGIPGSGGSAGQGAYFGTYAVFTPGGAGMATLANGANGGNASGTGARAGGRGGGSGGSSSRGVMAGSGGGGGGGGMKGQHGLGLYLNVRGSITGTGIVDVSGSNGFNGGKGGNGDGVSSGGGGGGGGAGGSGGVIWTNKPITLYNISGGVGGTGGTGGICPFPGSTNYFGVMASGQVGSGGLNGTAGNYILL